MHMNEIKMFLEQILNNITDDFNVEYIELGGQKILHIKTGDSKVLIGKRGDNLKSINHLIKKIAIKMGIEDRFLVDINEYKMKEIKDIAEKAKMLANRARTLQYNVEMPPMSAYERLIVHATLSDEPGIETESHGEGRDRKLVIKFIG